MPLSATVLSGLLQTELSSALDITDEEQLELVCDAIAAAVVTHIQTAAVVSGTVTTGVGAGGLVVGTVG